MARGKTSPHPEHSRRRRLLIFVSRNLAPFTQIIYGYVQLPIQAANSTSSPHDEEVYQLRIEDQGLLKRSKETKPMLMLDELNVTNIQPKKALIVACP